MTDALDPEHAILWAIPGRDPLSTRVRHAMLTALHAGQMAELQLPLFADWMSYALEEPPWSLFWYGPVAAEELAIHLETAARELRKASAAIDAAKHEWQRFDDSGSEEGHVIGVRSDRKTSDPEDDVPF